MARTRDAQRARCYKAEREAFSYYPGRVLRGTPGATLGEYKYGKAMSVQEMQELQILIGGSKKILDKWRNGDAKRVRVEISGRRTRGGAASYGGKVQYSPKAMLDWIVCHEMAHELNDCATSLEKKGDGGAYNHASHGWRFCAIYLDIVRWVIGVEAAEALKASFKRNKVRFTPPIKRAKKDPTLAQLAARTAFAERAKERALARRVLAKAERCNARVRFLLVDSARWGEPMTLDQAEAKAVAQGF